MKRRLVERMTYDDYSTDYPPYVIIDAPEDGGKWFVFYNIDGGEVLTYICAKDEDTAYKKGEELAAGDGFNRAEDLAIDVATEDELEEIEELLVGDTDVVETRELDLDIFDEDFDIPTEEVLEDFGDWDDEDDLIPPQVDDDGIIRICQSLYADDKSAVAFVKDNIWDEDGSRFEFTDWVYNLCDAFQLNCGIKTSTQIYNAILKDKRFMGMLRNDFDDLNA
jgi:hypothetical protein